MKASAAKEVIPDDVQVMPKQNKGIGESFAPNLPELKEQEKRKPILNPLQAAIVAEVNFKFLILINCCLFSYRMKIKVP